MTGKQFLRQNFKYAQALDCKIEQLTYLQMTAHKITQTINQTPTIAEKSFSRIENAVVNVLQDSDVISKDIVKFLEYRSNVVKNIDKVLNDNERILLEYRYLNFRKWKEIAYTMRMSLQYVYKLHDRALQSFEKIFNE